MALIKEIEAALPLVGSLPKEWQKDIVLIISKMVLAYDATLTMTPAECKAARDREIAAALQLLILEDASKEIPPVDVDADERQY